MPGVKDRYVSVLYPYLLLLRVTGVRLRRISAGQKPFLLAFFH